MPTYARGLFSSSAPVSNVRESERDLAAEAVAVAAAASNDGWIEIQLTPLRPPYKSSWSGNADEMRLAASTQVLFPPGFINS